MVQRWLAHYGVHSSCDLPQSPAAQPCASITARHIKYVAVGSDRTARDAPCHGSTLLTQANKSLTDSTCVRRDPGSWRASLATHDARRDYGGETTDHGRSLLCTSARPRVDPLQVDRAIDAGRARAVICGTNEQRALSAVAAAHGVESQHGAPVHGRGAQVMSLLDLPAAQAR